MRRAGCKGNGELNTAFKPNPMEVPEELVPESPFTGG